MAGGPPKRVERNPFRPLRLAVAWAVVGASPAFAQGVSSVPPLQMFGFADVDYVESEWRSDEGFELGQLVGHISTGLSERLTFFGEVSVTPRSDAYRFEVERAILRYDFGDRFRLSGGRYHTPINFWNTAYHHGLWLQTTVARPEMIRFGSKVLPVHFVGLLAEGNFAGDPLGVHLGAGLGNGRQDDIARAGDAGDTNEHRAALAYAYARPPALFGLQFGGAVYLDRVAAEGIPIDERILAAHVAFTRERPEVIAEYARIAHEPESGGEVHDTDAGYVQVAYRLPEPADRLKPYARYERIDASGADPLFGPLELDYEAGIVGVRFDFITFATLKAEVRSEDSQGEGSGWSGFLQVAFTFGGETGEAPRVVSPVGAGR